jgi:hypothetical protein
MSACPWATPAIDARIVALREAKVSLSGMVRVLFEEFGVTLTVDKLSGRTRVLGLPVLTSVVARREMHAHAEPVAPGAWTSPECDTKFRAAWDEGTSHRQLAAQFKVIKSTLVRRARLLGFPEREGRPVRRTPQEPPLRPRSVSGRHGSSIMFRGLATLPTGAVEHVAGVCRWPLSCGSPCDGRFCSEHAALLKQRRAA